MNSLGRDHLPATFFDEYQSLRQMLLEILSDDDLLKRLGGTTATLGELCREIGEIEHSYIESLKTFRHDFDYRHTDLSVETSVDSLAAWHLVLDSELAAAIAAISEEDVATARSPRGDFAPLPAVRLDIYRDLDLLRKGERVPWIPRQATATALAARVRLLLLAACHYRT